MAFVEHYDCMPFMKCQECVSFDTMEANFWPKTLRWCLGSNDLRRPFGGPCHTTVYHEQTTNLHVLWCSETGRNT